MRTHADQTDRALKEQARTMKEMSAGAQNTGNQVRSITAANKEQSTMAAALLGSLKEIRLITERNAGGVKRTRSGTDDLMRRAAALTALSSKPSTRQGKPVRQGKQRPVRSNGA
jgi:methyl-accepting chemotaxis protein